MTSAAHQSYDAALLVSFGGPEGPDDVVPFLENVTRGRGIPQERLREVGAHYFAFGGVSPINAANRQLLARVQQDFADHDLKLPWYWGNRNWTPTLAETVQQMADDGVQRALAFFTSAYSSYSGCRQYRENLADACAQVGPRAPDFDRIGPFYNHPGFVQPFVDTTVTALAQLTEPVRSTASLAFTTHSLPMTLALNSGVEPHTYVAQHQRVADAVAREVAERTGAAHPYDLVYQSRSGPPDQPWLEPDIIDHIATLAERDVTAVVCIPIGFVSDHLEVKWDLDTQARTEAERQGLEFARAATPGDDPRFVNMVRELVEERLLQRPVTERGRMFDSAADDRCAAGCCRNPRGDRPACCGLD